MIDSDVITRLRQEIKRSQKAHKSVTQQIKSLQQQEERLTRIIVALKTVVKNFQDFNERFAPPHRSYQKIFSQHVCGLIAQVFKQDNDWKDVEKITEMAIALDKQEGIAYNKAKHAVYTALCRLHKKGIVERSGSHWRLKATICQ
ncbi:hypothetical protein ACT2CV_04320 [Pasteurellaceae bacterium 22721_9_1]